MKQLILFVSLGLLTIPSLGQDVFLPYAQGDVESFLSQNRIAQQPSVVLYNFDLESG